jgi:hypothetical protein
MDDLFVRYERGIARLFDRLGVGHPLAGDVLVYQQRLQENIDSARRYGDTQDLRAARYQITEQLNRLASETIGSSFNELTGIPAGGDASALPAPIRSTPTELPPEHRRAGAIFQKSVQARDIVLGDQTNINNIANFNGYVGAVYYGHGGANISHAPGQINLSLQALLDDLRTQLIRQTSPERQQEAVRQVDRLDAAISNTNPALMYTVLEWFQAHLPQQAVLVETLLRHPGVVDRVNSAGTEAIVDYQRRFGS